MSHETLLLLGAAVAVAALAGLVVDLLASKSRRRPWRDRNVLRFDKWHREAGTPWKPPDAADQLRIVMGAHFTAQAVLNKSEARLFRELCPIVTARNPAWQVIAQVSLGEILHCKDQEAFSCINSKRVDFLLMDGDCQPRHAIEYQGSGHHQAAAAARDAVKKEALRRAGIGYHEIVAGQTTPVELRHLVEKLVDRTDPVK